MKFHARGDFSPTRDFNADDVVATFNRMWKKDDPYHGVSGGAYDYFNDMGMAGPASARSTRSTTNTVKFTLTKPESPFIANLGMDFAAIHSAEYMAQMLKAGTPEQVDQNPIGTGPFVLNSLPQGRSHHLQRERQLLPRQAADRPSGVLDHAGPGDARSPA